MESHQADPRVTLLFTATTGGRYQIGSLSHIDSHAGEGTEERAARKPFVYNIVRGGPCAIILLSENNIPPANTKVNQICQGLLVQLTGSKNANHNLLKKKSRLCWPHWLLLQRNGNVYPPPCKEETLD